MELRLFAEQVLFSSSLEEKLFSPIQITDDFPGSSIASPNSPGRPSFLRFKASDSDSPAAPHADSLDNPLQRGRLLHFFANHELLATELMALVLLRFPDAPSAFRRGVLNTLRDEQEHTRLYLKQMEACGVTFGELPVSGFFWRCVSSMESPIDYVSSLSLTFEQANLDFCRFFSRSFQRVGDTSTAELLEGIYRDEIRHVAYGLKWFRHWKQAGDTDWEAFCRALRFPLSPRRAKGFGFNAEGRKAAGLTDDFIQHLDVYSRSKGRTPTVSWFNPFSEGLIAYGPGFTPVKYQAQLAQDLEILPAYLGVEDDVVLVRQLPSVRFLTQLKSAGFNVPEFRLLQGGIQDAGRGWERQKLRGFRPWAWGPDSVCLFQPFLPYLSSPSVVESPALPYGDSIGELYSKAWSAGFLKRFLATYPEPRTAESGLGPLSSVDWLCPADCVGVVVTSLESALEQMALFRACGYERFVAKRAFGLAGQSAIRLWEPVLQESQKVWLCEAVKGTGGVILEPWLERVMDYSIQLESTSTGLKLVGYSTLVVDHRGQYVGNRANPGFARHAPPMVADRLRRPGFNPGILAAFHERLIRELSPHFQARGHRGAVGIDAFLYSDPAGGVRLKPVVEINPRYTMGRVLLELMRGVAPGGTGTFTLVNRAMLRDRGITDFVAYAESLKEAQPVQLKGEPTPRIWEGAVCLNDPAAAQVVLACLEVSRAAESSG